MRQVAWMAGTSVISWLVVAAAVDRQTRFEVLCGMLGPLAIVRATWFLVEWGYKRDPGRLTPLMAAAFFGKMVFFAAYVTFMLRLLGLRTVPFVASFTSYFVALYLMEAFYMRRLFSGRPR